MKTINILINFNSYIQCHLNKQKERLAANYDVELDDIEIGDEYEVNWNWIKGLIEERLKNRKYKIHCYDVGYVQEIQCFFDDMIFEDETEISWDLRNLLDDPVNYEFDLPYFDEPDLFKNHCKRIQSNF